MEIIRLSPSRISEYQQCPQLYNYRVIQKLPEPISLDAERGTLVHTILEELMSFPAQERTLESAKASVPSHWQLQKESKPELSQLVIEDKEWIDRINALLENYFYLEDPRNFEPTHMEAHLELESQVISAGITELSPAIQLHGYVDRIDIAPTGEVRIVDYKTGKAPKLGYEEKSLFQLRFYALLWYRIHGQIPKLIQLLYLGDQKRIRSTPNEGDLIAAEKKVHQIGIDIAISIEKDYWPTQKSKLCDWCSFKNICPAFN